MKRLSVRLGIVGAVLAVGIFAIAQTEFWKKSDNQATAKENGGGRNRKPDPPKPIPPGKGEPAVLTPPPSTAFSPAGYNGSPASDDDDDDGSAGGGEDQPASDPYGSSGGYNPANGGSYGSSTSAYGSSQAYGGSSSYGSGSQGGASGYGAGETQQNSGSGSQSGYPSSQAHLNDDGTDHNDGGAHQPASLTVNDGRQIDADPNDDAAPAAASAADPNENADEQDPANGLRDETDDPTVDDGNTDGQAGDGVSAKLSDEEYNTQDGPYSTGATSGAAGQGGYAPAAAGGQDGYSPYSTGGYTPQDTGEGQGGYSPGTTGQQDAQDPYGSSGNHQPDTTEPSGGLSGVVGQYSPATDEVAQDFSAPGTRDLEGAQSPALSIEKIYPPEIQVNRPATLQMRVRNTGRVAAQHVTVLDRVPRGTELMDATPDFTQTPDGGLVWQLGTMKPGDEVTISLQIMPQAEGEIGSVAQVLFQAQASARTVCTRPELKLTHVAPRQVLIGQPLILDISLTNVGSGAASNVVLEEDVPEQFLHAAGNQLEYEIGTLQPGETKKIALELMADKAGFGVNNLIVHGDGELRDQSQLEIEVTAPKLQVALAGPRKRYLERQATYTLQVANEGTASARNVQLVAYLPKGMKFLETDNQGRYDAQSHAVLWSLEELPAKRLGEVKLTTLPVETGDQLLRVEGRADLGLSHSFEQSVLVDSLSELEFSIADSADPIELGSETYYEIRLTNKGSKTDTNIRLAAELPEELEFINGEGPTRGNQEGRIIVFEPLARLAPKEEAVYRLNVRGVKAGHHLVRAQVMSDDSNLPVTKEESTRIYTDD